MEVQRGDGSRNRIVTLAEGGLPCVLARLRRVLELREISVLDMNDAAVAARAKKLGIRSVPTVVIDGKLADCCAGRGPAEATLRAAGSAHRLIQLAPLLGEG